MEKVAFTIPEFQKISGINSRTGVYQEINAGRLKTIKCGRRRLIPLEAVNEWLALLRREAEEAQK